MEPSNQHPENPELYQNAATLVQPLSTKRYQHYRDAIAATLDPSHRDQMSGPRFIEIVEEIERDIEQHYEAEELWMQENLQLQLLLERGSRPLGS